MRREAMATVGADGRLAVDLGPDLANARVRVVVETLAPEPTAEWADFVRPSAGSISDPTFVRHPQGEYEERDPL